MIAIFIRFINIILVALLAGTSFGIWIGFNPSELEPAAYLEQQKRMVMSLNTLMVSLVIIATIVTLISAYQQKKDKVNFYLLILAAVFLASCIVISRFGNLPIQTEMMTWKSNALPDNWTEMRDKWWIYHIIRTWAELIALGLIAWSSVKENK